MQSPSKAEQLFLSSELLLLPETNVHASFFVNALVLSACFLLVGERKKKAVFSPFPFFLYSECMLTRRAKSLLFCHSALFLLTLCFCHGLKMFFECLRGFTVQYNTT